MSQPFQVDFCFNCVNLLLVVVIVKWFGSMFCAGFFFRSFSILKYVEVNFPLKKIDAIFNL